MAWEAIAVIVTFFLFGFSAGMVYQHIIWVKELKMQGYEVDRGYQVRRDKG